MKISIVLMVLLLSFTLNAQNRYKKRPSELYQWGINGRVKFLTLYILKGSPISNIQKGTIDTLNWIARNKIFYDRDGNTLWSEHITKEGSGKDTSTIAYTYTEDGYVGEMQRGGKLESTYIRRWLSPALYVDTIFNNGHLPVTITRTFLSPKQRVNSQQTTYWSTAMGDFEEEVAIYQFTPAGGLAKMIVRNRKTKELKQSIASRNYRLDGYHNAWVTVKINEHDKENSSLIFRTFEYYP